MAHLVENDNLPTDIHVESLVHRRLDHIPRRQPRLGVIVEEREELFARYLRGLGKFGLHCQPPPYFTL